jgi:tRNA wybutosine-synthesizing protein 2
MRARLVPVSALAASIKEDWVDTCRKPYVTKEGAYIPVRQDYDASHIIPERQRTGRGYQKLGDVILFHGDKPTPGEIQEIITRNNPRGILWIVGHQGVMRKPQINILYGNCGEVTHKESGISYSLDVEKVMFSQGNREEKRRIASLVKPGEKTGDMISGIGYFTLGIARAGSFVHAMEINPVSFSYLQQNICANNLAARIHASCGDCRTLISGIYDRIHMGHFDAISFLPTALLHATSQTTIHVHMLNDETNKIEKIIRDCNMYADTSVHRVKKTGPKTWHQVCDVIIT